MSLIKQKRGKKSTQVPVSAQDHLEAGVTEEDHGDRWVGSGDVAKALRFYQRANRLYRRSVDLDHGATWISQDAIYNIARMQFVIFQKVVKQGQLDGVRDQLEPEDGTVPSIIIDSIDEVISTHQRALQQLVRLSASQQPPVPVRDPSPVAVLYESSVKLGTELAGVDSVLLASIEISVASTFTDLLYNYGQVLVEAAEQTEQVDVFARAGAVFEKVLAHQIYKFEVEQIKNQRKQQPDELERDAYAQTQEEDDGTNGAGPDDILETLVTFLQCLTKLTEAMYGQNDEQSAAVVSGRASALLQQIEQVIQGFKSGDEVFKVLTKEAINESLIAVAQYQSTLAGDFQTLSGIWSSPELPVGPERALAQADAYIDLQEKNDEVKQLWSAYAGASQVLAKAFDGSTVRTPEMQRRVFVARGDVDWLRSQLETEAAVKNRPVLVKNAKVLYANAINVPALAQDIENELLVREATVKRMILEGASAEQIAQIKGADSILRGIQQQGLQGYSGVLGSGCALASARY